MNEKRVWLSTNKNNAGCINRRTVLQRLRAILKSQLNSGNKLLAKNSFIYLSSFIHYVQKVSEIINNNNYKFLYFM